MLFFGGQCGSVLFVDWLVSADSLFSGREMGQLGVWPSGAKRFGRINLQKFWIRILNLHLRWCVGSPCGVDL